MEILELTRLADKFGCDKGSIKHNYTSVYEEYLSYLKEESFNMLEIGYGKGLSAKMWLSYFQNVVLYYIDINKKSLDGKLLKQSEKEFKLKYFELGQADKTIPTIFKDIKFKVIIDDGSHVTTDQQISLAYLFPLLENGGLYIIEDLDSKKSERATKAKRMVKLIQEYNKTNLFHSEILDSKQLDYINRHIDNIKLYCNNKLVFIQKK